MKAHTIGAQYRHRVWNPGQNYMYFSPTNQGHLGICPIFRILYYNDFELRYCQSVVAFYPWFDFISKYVFGLLCYACFAIWNSNFQFQTVNSNPYEYLFSPWKRREWIYVWSDSLNKSTHCNFTSFLIKFCEVLVEIQIWIVKLDEKIPDSMCG